MSRIRTIKPEFFLDEDLSALSPLHRLLFIGLWTLADREGRLDDRPRRIKVQLLPFDDADVSTMLSDLDKAGFIQRYVVDGKSFILVVNFNKHQRISGKESYTESQIPPPGGFGSTREAPEKQWGSTREAPEKHPRTQEGKGKEGKGESASDFPMLPPPEDLQSVWNDNRGQLPECKELSAARKGRARTCLTRVPDLSRWASAVQRVASSPFCLGQNDRGWRATFDWLLKDDTLQRIEEGKYDPLNAAPNGNGHKPQTQPDKERLKQREKERQDYNRRMAELTNQEALASMERYQKRQAAMAAPKIERPEGTTGADRDAAVQHQQGDS